MITKQITLIQKIKTEPEKCWRNNCICSHEVCERGWVEVRFKVVQEKRFKNEIKFIESEYDGVKPCETCDPERAQLFASSTSSAELTTKLQQRSQFKVAENYDIAEASKTRTL